jgi:hypothetical protein
MPPEEPVPVRSAVDEPWFGPGRAVLQAAVDEDFDRAGELLGDLHAAQGWQGLQSAMQMWGDWAVQAAGIDLTKPIKLRWREVNTNVVTDADNTPPAARWAGRMLMARAMMDYDTWDSLLSVGIGDNAAPFIQAYLEMCADQVRSRLVS